MRGPRASLLSILPLALACARASDPTPNVVLVVVDAMRADRLSAYGNMRPTSPHLDALAARGALFEDAWSTAPWTLPAAASLLTGDHPSAHGAGLEGGPRFHLEKDVVHALAPEATTLAERLARLGYRNEAFVTNAFMKYGLERGFESWRHRSVSGVDVADFAVRSLADPDPRPRFLLLHFMECHDPLLARDEDFLDVTGPSETPTIPPFFARTFLGAALPDHAQYRKDRLLAYDGAIHEVDRQIGRVLDAASRAANGRPAMVIATADHGEEVFDHVDAQRASRRADPRGVFGFGHGHVHYEEVLRVPLIVAAPGIAPRRVRDTVSLIDVAPTILDGVGAPVAEGAIDGRSLRPLMRGEAMEPRAAMAGAIAYGLGKDSWITERWHLVVPREPAEATELFDRVADPHETTNVAEARPEVVAELTAAMEAARRRVAQRAGAVATPESVDVERMRGVGYLGARR